MRLLSDESGEYCRFQYEVPENGVVVLIFFSTRCGNSQTLFRGLGSSAWVEDERVNVIAVESQGRLSPRRKCGVSFVPMRAAGSRMPIMAATA